MLRASLLSDWCALRGRGAAEDGGAYVNPIIDAIERLERRTGHSATIPRYLSLALTNYRFAQPFAAFALHDAMARFCCENDVPQYAWDALIAAEEALDLRWRDDLESLGPEAPRVATQRTPLHDAREGAKRDRWGM